MLTDDDFDWGTPALPSKPGVVRAIREPEPTPEGWDKAAAGEHTCEPIGESAYPPDVVGDDLSRWLAHPCIGWEPAASSCDLAETEAAVRVMPIEAAAELYLWLRSQATLVRGKAGWEGHHALLTALCGDLARKPRLAAFLRGWEQETAARRAARVRAANDAIDPEDRRRAEVRDMGNAAVDAAPLPEPSGWVG